MSITATQTPEIVTDTGALTTLLTAALREGLPMPATFHAHGSCGPTLLFDGIAQLTEWAIWLDECIGGADGKHVVRCDWLDWPVNLIAFSRDAS